jgi:uncharacterized protein YecE (DUF72 family)
MISARIPDPYRSSLRIGTCSWKYDSWKGLLYERGKMYRPEDYLRDYSVRLNSVEVDQWFWSLFPEHIRLPDVRTVRQYAEAVPDDFVFTVKAPNSLTLTHFYSKQPAAYAATAGAPNPHFFDTTLLERFLERLSPLGRKLGPVMFQFEYLNRTKMPSLNHFLDRLQAFISKAPRGFRYAVETRNPNYLSVPFFRSLKEAGLGYVYIEGYYMPSIGALFEKFAPEAADFSILRLHGGDRQEIEELSGGVWDRLISPKPDSLEAAARIVRANSCRGVVSYVNVNNHLEGSAPLTIERFLDALARENSG